MESERDDQIEGDSLKALADGQEEEEKIEGKMEPKRECLTLK